MTQDYPYLLHTGAELELMLQGTKPLAVFCDALASSFDEAIIPEQAFAPYVDTGRIVKRTYVVGEQPNQWRRVLYALPQEAWRIDAYLLMWDVAEKSGWNETLERMEGRLLGYEDWQCDFHIQHQVSNKK
jgi:hypothetical protein